MKGIAAAFAGLIVMACSGCGGGGGSSSQPQSMDINGPAPVVRVVLIDAEGDSTMCGYDGTACQPTTAPPAVLQSMLQRTFGPTVSVQNNGVPGTIINQDLNGSSIQPLTPRLMASSAQIVIENFGLNDAVKVTPESFRNDLNTWISAVQAAGKTPILEEPNPTRSGSPATDAIVAVINDVALQRGVALIKQYDYIRTLPNWQSMLVDNLHPSPQLYTIKAQREYDVLAPIVKGMQ